MMHCDALDQDTPATSRLPLPSRCCRKAQAMATQWMTLATSSKRGLAAVLATMVLACTPGGSGPQSGSQTNWLKVCDSDAQCGELACMCGTCTRACDVDVSCADLPGAACVAPQALATLTLCGQTPASAGLCLLPCGPSGCPSGSACVDGTCSAPSTPSLPAAAPSETPDELSNVVTISSSIRYQTLVGFGASIAYQEGAIVAHPRKEALYDAMFGESGFDFFRLRNRYGHAGDDELTRTFEIVSAASARLGRTPTLLLTSGSPPAQLKANGSAVCSGNLATCTLITRADGSFDYQGFADYWRASLEAYARAGIAPDYISIQNNPNWVPLATAALDGCRFLPIEGLTTVPIDGINVYIRYPGFAEALTAVATGLSGLASVPQIVGPETTGAAGVVDYAPHLEMASVSAFAHHLYGTDPSSVDREVLTTLHQLGQQYERPIFQTEMRADGLGTAVLMQNALVSGGASVYLQNDFVVPEAASITDVTDLISLGADGFTLEPTYFAIRHFARDTDPGWVRVDASTNVEQLLTSAWLSPSEDAFTVVLVNPSATEYLIELRLGELPATTSSVTLTAFAGVERAAELGPLSAERTVTIPGEAMVTVAFRR
jgi:glucuronoarabinoxylan endo-1,4-beta-xylanase